MLAVKLQEYNSTMVIKIVKNYGIWSLFSVLTIIPQCYRSVQSVPLDC